MGGVREVLAFPLYRRIVVGRFISGLGNWFFVISLGWVMLRRTEDPVVVGAVMAAFRLPILVLSPFTGRFISRYGTRRVGTWSFSIAAAATVGLVLESFIARVPTGAILGWVLVIGAALALGSPASLYALGQAVPPGVRHTAVAFGSVTFNLSRSVGPVLGGLLLALTNTRTALLVNGMTFVPLAVIMARTPDATVPVKAAEAAALRWIRSDRVAAGVFAMTGAICLLAAPLQAFGPVLARNHGDAPFAAELYVTAIGLGGLLTGIGLTLRDPGARRTGLMVGAALTSGLGLLIVSQNWGVGLTVVGLVLVGIGVEAAFVEVQAVAQVSAPVDLRSAVVGLGFSLTVGGLIVGSMILGPAFRDHMNLTLVICGLLLIGSALLFQVRRAA